MMKKLLLILVILVILVIGGLIMGFTNPELKQLLDKATQRIMALEMENLQLKIKQTDLNRELGQIKLERKEDKFIIDTVDTLTKGVTVTAWANPDHIRYVKESCKRWEYIVVDLKKTEKLACWQFVYCRLLATGLNSNFKKQNLNGSYDNGIGDLNDCVLEEIQKDMDKDPKCPNWIKKGNWYNIDKSIYGLYIWINQRRRMRMPFADLQFYQWQMYSKIKD